eukprot:Sspe_Gene.72995::Locus_43807_Transcript_1_1_Confidence_1.000_Length_1194::g.72995::m.72995
MGSALGCCRDDSVKGEGRSFNQIDNDFSSKQANMESKVPISQSKFQAPESIIFVPLFNGPGKELREISSGDTVYYYPDFQLVEWREQYGLIQRRFIDQLHLPHQPDPLLDRRPDESPHPNFSSSSHSSHPKIPPNPDPNPNVVYPSASEVSKMRKTYYDTGGKNEQDSPAVDRNPLRVPAIGKDDDETNTPPRRRTRDRSDASDSAAKQDSVPQPSYHKNEDQLNRIRNWLDGLPPASVYVAPDYRQTAPAAQDITDAVLQKNLQILRQHANSKRRESMVRSKQS